MPDATPINDPAVRGLYKHAQHEVGVTADPDIAHYSISDDTKFIVLASDGIWDFVSRYGFRLFSQFDFLSPLVLHFQTNNK